MKSHLKIETHPAACAGNIIQGDRYRITVLTTRLIRLEYSEDGVFNDAATQTVLNRDFPETVYQLKETEEELDLDYCRESCSGSFSYALSNSLGFGGHNASILIRSYTG